MNGLLCNQTRLFISFLFIAKSRVNIFFYVEICDGLYVHSNYLKINLISHQSITYTKQLNYSIYTLCSVADNPWLGALSDRVFHFIETKK